jgi:hypothetical protein
MLFIVASETGRPSVTAWMSKVAESTHAGSPTMRSRVGVAPVLGMRGRDQPPEEDVRCGEPGGLKVEGRAEERCTGDIGPDGCDVEGRL